MHSLRYTLLLLCSAALAQNPAVTIQVDAAANRRPIDPRIYGVNFAGATALSALNIPLHRNGGNNSSRYNWQLNADNLDADWYFESNPDSDPSAGGRGDAVAAGASTTLGFDGSYSGTNAKPTAFTINGVSCRVQ